MDSFLKALGEMISSGNSGSVMIAMSILLIVLSVFFALKIVQFMKDLGFTNGIKRKVTVEDIDKLRQDVEKDTNRIEDAVKSIHEDLVEVQSSIAQLMHYDKNVVDDVERIEATLSAIKSKHYADVERLNSIAKDINSCASDSKSKQQEITQAVTTLQRDLASLHGSILALNTSGRTKLK